MHIHIPLDRIDRLILSHLQANAKLTNSQLAQTIGLSPAATLERVRKLERGRVIEGYHAKLSLEKLSLQAHVLLHIALCQPARSNAEKLQKCLIETPWVVEHARVMGGEIDFFVRVAAPSLTAYQDTFLEILGRLNVVQKMSAYIITGGVFYKGLPTHFDKRQLAAAHCNT